jgi:hypothetical protein
MEEPIMVKYDGTVRNSLGDAIQFLYGTTKGIPMLPTYLGNITYTE